MNIVYFTPHLREASGINRVLSIKANYLADVLNYKVTIITYRQHNSAIFFPFSKNVELVHFDLDDPSFRLHSLSFFEKRRQLKRFMSSYKDLVSQYLFDNKTDICISLLLGAEYKFLSEIKDGSKKIVEFHMSFDQSPFKLLNKKFEIRNTRAIIQLKMLQKKLMKFDKFITLTEADAQNWKKYFSNVCVIANPLTIQQTANPDLLQKKAIAVGRLEKEKGFDYLIDAWQIVHKKHPDWCLEIYGNGSLKEDLHSQINAFGLGKHIFLRNPVPNITEKYQQSSIFILSSLHEGFGLALMEALSSGLPTVAFQCDYGPRELINDAENGYLVAVGNTDMMAEKIITLIENRDLRKKFSQNAVRSVKRFALPQIMQQWDQLFKSFDR